MQPNRENRLWTSPLGALANQIPGLVSRSLPMRRICEQLQQVGQRVRLALIEGEAGTGKYLLARHIYALGPAEGNLVTEEAVALFGPEGVGPGGQPPGEALREAVGRAAEGLLLIRNIDELTAEPQVQLLRFIRSFETTLSPGMPRTTPSSLQVICTTRQSLRARVLAGKFLPELYYRLSAVSFSLPALRERKEDIPALAQMFIDAASRDHRRPLQGLGPGSLAILLRHRWPGNVRELESVIKAACLAVEGQWLRPIDLVLLPLESVHHPESEPAVQELNLDMVIRRHILRVLKVCDGNKARAAARLGISRSTLYRMLESDLSRSMEGQALAGAEIAHDSHGELTADINDSMVDEITHEPAR